MDIKLPVMSGIEATKQIRMMDSKVPIIAQTAHALGTPQDEAVKAGCNYVIHKPINQEKLYRILDECFDDE